jgi:signal transduction histidine kinase
MEFHHVMEAAGVLVIGLVFYSYTLRDLQALARLGRRGREIVTGLAFGGLAVLLMVSRIQVAEGTYIDARAVPIALIGLYEGWLAVALAAGVAVVRRVWIGGSGQVAGVLGLVATAAVAGFAHAWAQRDGGVRARHALSLAGAVFVTTGASYLLLGARGLHMLEPIVAPLLVLSFVGVGCGAYLFRDLVQSRMAEQARREAAELRAVTLLARAAAHEINNPLTIVVGGIALIGKRFTPESEEGQWIARVNEGALRIKDIVARMNNITEIAEAPTIGLLPRMLDIKKSGRPVGEAR